MSSIRKAAVLVGLGILGVAGWQLAGAILHAAETGTVLMGETTRSSFFRGTKWSYPALDAWAYFVGWIAIGCSGALLTTASSKRLGRVVLVPVACLLGFILIAAAPMLGSVAGVALFLVVLLGGSATAVTVALWVSTRIDRQSRNESGEQRRRNGEAV